MKRLRFNILFLFLLIFSSNILISTVHASDSESTHVYLNEYKNFKHNPEFEGMFDAEINECIRNIQRDVEIYKELSLLQRMIRFIFFTLDVVVVTKNSMPMLYGYIEDICKTNNITIPTVFIATNRGFFNAAAQKLLMSSGAIVIGEKLVKEASDLELESVVAHELGHIKYDHINKMLLISLTVSAASYVAYANNIYPGQDCGLKLLLHYLLCFYGPSILIGKRFERQADEFACKQAQKAQGVIDFFQHYDERIRHYDDAYDQTHEKIQNNSTEVGTLGYGLLMLRYYAAKLNHGMQKYFRWLYHETRYGAHPSPRARIEAAQDYLANH